jgi:hypothetical protein
MALDEDRNIIIAALESAMQTYRDQRPRPSLLSGPGDPVIQAICDAISNCKAFQQVAGKMLFTGGSGPVINPHLFAVRLFYKAEQNDGKDIPATADWFLRLLATRETSGLFKAAIWGVTIDKEIRFSDGSRIMPFEDLQDTFLKRRIMERAHPCYDGSAWLAHNNFDAPKAAFVKEVPTFPYIGTSGSPFRIVSDLQYEARDFWLIIEAACVGHPTAMGSWFEYVDEELDVNGWESQLAWLLPEIHPRVGYTPVSAKAVEEQMQKYAELPEELRLRLLRSMERFTLSQCRHKFIDRVLDLELAFEIAVSGPSKDASPMGWKVSVRSAQMIGGALSVRQSNRDLINELFRLRSAATHGSDLSGRDQEKLQDTVRRCLTTYRSLITSFIALGRTPDWSALELQPRIG